MSKKTLNPTLTFNLDSVPYAEDYFFADKGKVTLVGDQIVFSFISTETISNKVSLCVEIIVPVEVAVEHLYKSNFIEPSLNGNKMNEVVSTSAALLSKNYKIPEELNKIEYPQDSSNYRKFTSNFFSACIYRGQASIDFFQIPPRMIVDKLFKNSNSNRAGNVTNVISVIFSTFLFDSILKEGESILAPIYKDMANEK